MSTTATLQVLTPASVRAAARDYYAKGLLTAQAPNPAQRWCKIEVDDYRCAIGAALNNETMDRFHEAGGDASVQTGVTSLVDSGFIDIAAADLPEIANIQYLHDCWANGARHASTRVPLQEAAFLAAIKD